jgi:hypothetical protein
MDEEEEEEEAKGAGVGVAQARAAGQPSRRRMWSRTPSTWSGSDGLAHVVVLYVLKVPRGVPQRRWHPMSASLNGLSRHG